MRGINHTPTFTLTLGWEKIHNTNILCGYHWIKKYVVSPENGTFCLNNDSFLLKTQRQTVILKLNKNGQYNER